MVTSIITSPLSKVPQNLIENVKKFPPLDHRGPEMKCAYCYRDCCKKKIAQNERPHAMDISIIPFNRKNIIFKKCQKFIFSNGKRSYQPKYHIPR